MITYILWYISLNAIILLLLKKDFDYVVTKDIEEDDPHRGILVGLMVVLALLILIPLLVWNILKQFIYKQE